MMDAIIKLAPISGKWQKRFIVFFTMAILSIGAVALLFPASQAEATHTYWESCNAANAETTSNIAASPPVPTGNGFLYQTLEIRQLGDSSQTGHTIYGECTLDRSNVLEYAGLFADQVWIGPEIPSQGWFNPRPAQGCLAQTPTQPGVYRCDTDGTYDFVQDDAGAITFGGNGMIYCNGIGEFCGNDIYRNGWWPAAGAVAGAGYANLASPTQLGGNGLAGDGRLNDIPMQFWSRNTYPGGWGVHITLTFRYPQNPPWVDSTPVGDAVLDCNTIYGWAHDDDVYPGQSIDVHIYRDGPAGSGIWTGSATADQNPNADNFTFDISAYQDASAHTYYIYAIGKDNSGNTNGNNPLIATRTIGPCRRPPTGSVNYVDCNTIRGEARDEDAPWDSIDIHVWVDAPGGSPSAYDSFAWPTDGAHNFDITRVGEYKDYSTHRFWIYAEGVDAAGNPDGQYVLIGDGVGTGAPCAPPACGSMQTYNDDPPQPGVPFGVRVNFNYSPGNRGRPISAARGHTMRLTVGGTPYNNGNQPYNPYDPVPGWPPGAGQADTGPPSLVIATAGTYTVTMTVAGVNLTPNPCEWQFQVVDRPYFRAFQGDVAVGGGSAACNGWPTTAGSDGRILAFTRGSGNGAGTQLLAQATGIINGFSSAQGRGAYPVVDKGLSFSNTAGNLTYGGSFGAGICPSDFFAKAGNIQPSGTVIGPRSLANGVIETIYVDGDAYIAGGNITYAGSGGGWATVNDIPSFALIARGNIFIDHGVTRLEGVFIAQPKTDGTGGTIYTCAVGNAIPTSTHMASGVCRTSQLTVYGSVIARTLKLFRTSGSLSTANNFDLSPYTASTAAEKFIYGPEIWLRSNGILGGTNAGSFDAITSLPPIL